MCSQYVLRALTHPNHATNKQNALEGPPVTGGSQTGFCRNQGFRKWHFLAPQVVKRNPSASPLEWIFTLQLEFDN